MNECEELRDALKGMVTQFAARVVHDGRTALSAMGLSALEEAFTVLGMDDPSYQDDAACEVEECHRWGTSGEIWSGMYLHLCGGHSLARLAGETRPPIRQAALEREAHRGPDGTLASTAERAK